MKKLIMTIMSCVMIMLVVACTSDDSKDNKSTILFDFRTESKVSDFSSLQQEISQECTQSEASNQSNLNDDITVYKTPTGKRYHLDPDCGGKNSTKTVLKTAVEWGLTPCQKCAKYKSQN